MNETNEWKLIKKKYDLILEFEYNSTLIDEILRIIDENKLEDELYELFNYDNGLPITITQKVIDYVIEFQAKKELKDYGK